MARRASLIVVGVSALVVAGAGASDQGDSVKGEKVFRKCKACHQVGPAAVNRIGPILNGIVGRPAGKVEGFKYSPANMKAGQGGLVWTEETLNAYLENPRKYMPGNKMAFVGLRRPQQRLDVIAYLRSFEADGSTAE